MRRRGAVLKDRIRKRAKRAGLELPDRLVEKLHDYVDLLRHWNERMNLTALDEKDAGLDRLLIEPLVAATHLPVKDGHLIDIGSGGGSPAIPIKLATSESSLVMVESKTRKAAFLREATRQLALGEVVVEAERYETLLARPDLHEGHDVLTLRAVRIEGRVLRGLQAFLKPGGLMFLFRGGGATDVPTTLELPLVWVATYPLVHSLGSRLVVLEKRK